MRKSRILIVEDEAIVREDLRDLIEALGYEVAGLVSSGADALARVAELEPDLVLMDIRLKGAMDGIEVARRIRARSGMPVIFLTAFADERTIERAKEVCPHGYLTKPFNERAIRATIEVALHRHREENPLPGIRREASVDNQTEPGSFHGIIGRSSASRTLWNQIQRVAQVETTVLIEGETGTGKERVARAIHSASARASQPFIAVNSAGLTEALAAAELFGHRRGAFTGAVSEHKGVFEAAQGGTVFLDEIGDIPKAQQAYLLRVLEQREVTRVGETTPRRIDARVLAATHRKLDDEVAAGRFRADLLYRIRVARILVAPLRERTDDIPPLAQSFLSQFCQHAKVPQKHLSEEILNWLTGYRWPGNVRELKNAVEYAAIRSASDTITVEDLPPEVVAGPVNPNTTPLSPEQERERILQVLAEVANNRSEAARRLGISRATFYRRLSELGLEMGEE